MRIIVSDFLYSLRLALRSGVGWVAAGMLMTVIMAALLSAYFGGRQLATVALDVGISAIRLLLPLFIVLVVQELLSREFDRRFYLGSLAYPKSRSLFLLGRLLAALVLLLLLLSAMSFALIFLVEFVGGGYAQSTPVALGRGYFIVVAFIMVDLLVLTAVAALLAVVASTPSFVLIGTFGFMLVARSYGGVIELLGRDGRVVENPDGYRSGLDVLRYFLPDLGALDVRMIALYGEISFLPYDWPWLLTSCLGYVVFILTLAVYALQRKRFS